MCSVRGIGVALSASTSTSTPELAQQLLLRDAEPLLLVDDDEAEILRDRVAREDPVRPDQDVDLALAELGEHLLHVGGLAEARDHLDADREVAVALAEGVPVLLGEDRRRDEHQHLLPGDGDREGRAERHLRLAEADVAADEPVHRARRLEVFLDRLDRARLILGLAVGESGLELLDPFLVDVVGDPDARLTLGVELEQLAGHLAQMLAGADLEVVPGLAAELREGRRVRVGADVAGDLADLLVRDVDAVLAAEAEQEVVAGDARDLLRLEAEQLRDAVVLVDDVVAGAQVGEARERAAGRRDRPGGRRRKTWVSGRSAIPRSRQTKPRRTGETANCRPVGSSPGSSICGLDTAEEPAPPLGLAAMRERDDDVEPLAEQPLQLVLGLREAAGDERRALRLEREQLPLRQRVELGRAVEGDLGEALLGPDARTSSGCQTKSGGAASGGTRSAGISDVVFVRQPDLGGVDPPFGSRIDGDALGFAERALREGREGADALDLVPEELDPERLAAGAREDVDEPAAHGDLAALLDPLDPLVPGERELLGERLDPRLVAARELDRSRARSPAAACPPRPRTRRRRRARLARARRGLAPSRRRGAAAARARSRGGRRATAGARRGRRRGTSRRPRPCRVRRRRPGAARRARGRAPRGARRAGAAAPARRHGRARAAPRRTRAGARRRAGARAAGRGADGP